MLSSPIWGLIDLAVGAVSAGNKPLKVCSENGGGFRIRSAGGHGVDVVRFFPVLILDRAHTGGGVFLLAVADSGDAGAGGVVDNTR